MIYPDLDLEIPDDLGRVHFVGIGGSGMHGIARMLHARGVFVTGSDRSENAATKALKELGVTVHIGHAAEHVAGADTLVVTGALWQDNPEYQYALQNNIPVLHRSQALAWLTRNRRLVAVAGAHGKTTSTGMVVTGLLGVGADPSFVNGGVIESLRVSARDGVDDTFIIEADESDRSFLLYDTAIAVITNVDPEHLDFYGSRENFMQAFVDFARAASEVVIASSDDPGTQEVLAALPEATRVVTFGLAETADVRVSEIDVTGPVAFTVTANGESVRTQLQVFGAHNAVNAAGAVATLLHLGYILREAAAAVANFAGTKRRFEFHAEIGGVRIYDDYAHHPTEVAALLAAARPVAQPGRLIAVHQPHLFSRTQHFHKEFAEVLENGADYTIVLPVDGAREDPVPGVTGALVSNDFNNQDRVRYIDNWADAAAHVAEIAKPGDLFVTMSCGSVYQIIPQLVEELIAANPAADTRLAPGF
ncbi:UDP-N-acetylmuramate--L-alanine ligase [Canibacter zhoujuaniae]|uniref:UDP-N-acetylmuramate--L-alanine ligase n=1 Tax=Canibacter zhoujuaniae TaxID=2708343 RepID=UPI001423856A|nr:UDP-N-acetylmuramate--L-alanine ligase [Canibacter zhoujuaniae]